jgi:hypothetical protein
MSAGSLLLTCLLCSLFVAVSLHVGLFLGLTSIVYYWHIIYVYPVILLQGNEHGLGYGITSMNNKYIEKMDQELGVSPLRAILLLSLLPVAHLAK